MKKYTNKKSLARRQRTQAYLTRITWTGETGWSARQNETLWHKTREDADYKHMRVMGNR